MGLHFVIFSLGRNGLYCYGFPNLRMRFCGMYGVPAALAIADAVHAAEAHPKVGKTVTVQAIPA